MATPDLPQPAGDGKPHRFSDEFTRRMVRRAQGGDAAARETIVRAFSDMVFAVGGEIMPDRRNTASIDFADLTQSGFAALSRAIDLHDTTRAGSFSGHAWGSIRGGMLTQLRNQRSVIRPPYELRQRPAAIAAARAELEAAGVPVTPATLAKAAGMTEDIAGVVLRYTRSVASLDAPAAEGSATTLSELVGQPDDHDPLAEYGLSESENAYLTLRSEGFGRKELAPLMDTTVDALRYKEERIKAKLSGEPAAGAARISYEDPANSVASRLHASAPDAATYADPASAPPAIAAAEIEAAFHKTPPYCQARLGAYASEYIRAGASAAQEAFAKVAGSSADVAAGVQNAMQKLRAQLPAEAWTRAKLGQAFTEAVVPAIAAAQARQLQAIASLPEAARVPLAARYVEGQSIAAVAGSGVGRAANVAALERAEVVFASVREKLPELSDSNLPRLSVSTAASTSTWSADQVLEAYESLQPIYQARLGAYCAVAAERGPKAAGRVVNELFPGRSGDAAHDLQMRPFRLLAEAAAPDRKLGRAEFKEFRAAAVPIVAERHALRLEALASMSAAERAVIEPAVLGGELPTATARLNGLPRERFRGAFDESLTKLHAREARLGEIKRQAPGLTARQTQMAAAV